MDINTQYGLEPTMVLAIDFTDYFITHAFGAFPSAPRSPTTTIKFWSDKVIYKNDGKTVLYPGKIIEMSPISSSQGFDGNSASSDVTVVIDDSDLTILNLLGSYNIQKVPAYIYLYLPPGSLTVVFEGIVVSGFKWSDKNKTATFTILNTVVEREVGFSPEQGYISDLPLPLIGKPWPFGYGTVIKYPAIQINYSPVAILTAPFGIVDWSLHNELQRLSDIQGTLSAIYTLDFESALGAYFSGFQDLGDQLTDEGNAALLQLQTVQSTQLSIQDILAEQLLYEQDQTVITNIPKTLTGVFSVGDTVLCQGKISINQGRKGFGSEDTQQASGPAPIGNTSGVGQFKYIGPYFPTGGPFFLPNYSPAQVQPFYFIQAGTLIKYLGALPSPDGSTTNYIPESVYPLKFVVNCLGGTVKEVYAYKTVEGSHRLTNVPKAYWKVTSIITNPPGIVTTVPTFTALGVTTKLPLSSFLNQFWDDQIYVSYTSSIGPGLGDILSFLINTYTNFLYTGGAPEFNCSFATVEQKDVMTQIKELCFQCNTAVWVSEGMFHFLYLPSQPSSATSIGLSDIIADTLEIGITTTENIITKIKAAWFYTYELDTRNYYQLRYNDFKYGIHELAVDYYAFQDLYLISQSASFWLYRKGNTWKRLKFSMPWKFINLQIFDCITLGSDIVNLYKLGTHGSHVLASIISISLDPVTYLVNIELELPIYVGSMKNSPAYWLSNYSGHFYQIDEAYGLTETPQQTIAYQRGQSVAQATSANEILLEEATQFQGSGTGSGYGISSPDPVSGNSTPQNLDVFTRTDSGIQLASFYTGVIPSDIPEQSQEIKVQYPPPNYKYAYADFPKPTGTAPANPATCVPGMVLDFDGQSNLYSCIVYPDGVDSSSTATTIKASLLQDAKGDTPVPKGTWALFSVIAGPSQSASNPGILSDNPPAPSPNADGNFYYFTVPLWFS